jgi:hypothetical protein
MINTEIAIFENELFFTELVFLFHSLQAGKFEH